MTTPTYPGVYVEEVSSGVRPITAASTSTAAFIGIAEKGSLSEAVKIYNFTQFQNLYGGFLTGSSFLAHAVYQFFNNGGAQCYIVRVAGDNVRTASIDLSDRGVPAQHSLTIAAVSPGFWGNSIEAVISDGTRDPGNEFNLKIYEGETLLRESYENLSMVPSAPNFVETATRNSKFILVTVNKSNLNATAGTSRGADKPTLGPQFPSGQGRLRINVNNDGYQEINLETAVGSGTGKVADLNTVENVGAAIQFVVRALKPQRTSTHVDAFSKFTCTLDNGVLLLTSGTMGKASSVIVEPAATEAHDATALLKLGRKNGGMETVGTAVAPRYLVGDHNVPADGVFSKPGSDNESSGVVAGIDDFEAHDGSFINAFQRLNNIDDVSLLAVPGRGSKDLVGAGMNYCANRSLRDCFFIGDMAPDDDEVHELQTFVDGISPKNSYGAVYAPWLLMLDPTGASQEPIRVPPSGFVAGMYAKTDAQRGVWKAPAGTAAALAGATGLVVNFTDKEQGNLTDSYHVNLIRQFSAAGRIIWGARTITSDAEWRYTPERRMAIFLRVSIYNGIQWATYEPNAEPLWSQLRLNIKSFMMTLFRRGAFQGRTPSQAFFVKCDNETTTQDDIDQGIVNVLVGFAPLKPAEFVMVKISKKAGQSS